MEEPRALVVEGGGRWSIIRAAARPFSLAEHYAARAIQTLSLE